MRGARIHGATHLEGVNERVQDGGGLEHPTRGGLYVCVWGILRNQPEQTEEE